MQTLNRPVTRSAESLGKVTYEVKPNVSNVVAGFILGAGLVVGGLVMTGYLLRQMFFAGGNPPRNVGDWAGALVMALLGLAVAVGGALLMLFTRSLIGFRLRVCADGFSFTRANRQSVFAWDEVVLVREAILEEKLPLAKGVARHLMAAKTTRTYTVVRCDGEEFYFDENVVPRTSLLAGPLTAAAKSRGIPWQTDKQEAR
jgi:hypothetical protein